MNWELVSVLACIAWAIWLVLIRVRSFLSGSGESGCSGCPKASADKEVTERIITADQITIRRD